MAEIQEMDVGGTVSEGQCKNGFLFGDGISGYGAVVQAKDLARKAQAYTRSALFCSKERNEDLVQYIWQNTSTIVRHLHGNSSALVPESF